MYRRTTSVAARGDGGQEQGGMRTEAPNETTVRVRSWRHRSGGPFQRGVERLMLILSGRLRCAGTCADQPLLSYRDQELDVAY